jgi:hypothetical protein
MSNLSAPLFPFPGHLSPQVKHIFVEGDDVTNLLRSMSAPGVAKPLCKCSTSGNFCQRFAVKTIVINLRCKGPKLQTASNIINQLLLLEVQYHWK